MGRKRTPAVAARRGGRSPGSRRRPWPRRRAGGGSCPKTSHCLSRLARSMTRPSDRAVPERRALARPSSAADRRALPRRRHSASQSRLAIASERRVERSSVFAARSGAVAERRRRSSPAAARPRRGRRVGRSSLSVAFHRFTRCEVRRHRRHWPPAGASRRPARRDRRERGRFGEDEPHGDALAIDVLPGS